MKKDIFPLEPNQFYHIYNRGINGGQLFFNHQNYLYFLKLISDKVLPLGDVYSYCLMQNHFHLLIKIKTEEEIRANYIEKERLEIQQIISQQFSNAFNSYTQAINKRFGRTGKLFELPFRRKIITTEQQLVSTVLYISKNPAKHKITSDCINYPYSSVNEILNENIQFVKSIEVVSMFNDKDDFLKALETSED